MNMHHTYSPPTQTHFPRIDHRAERGFTLIELSIVLVIIGLIVGGVLVGQDLIRAAEIRATISQVEKYNTEVNTFRTKYNGIPGDLPAQTASNFGNLAVLQGQEGSGDGNLIVEDGNAGAGGGGANTNTFAGEISTFWLHLTQASLIDGGFGALLTTIAAGGTPAAGGTGLPSVAATAGNMNQFIPPAKLGRGMSFIVFSGGGFNFYGMMPVTAISTAGAYTLAPTGISGVMAANIDTKLDDGLPNGGVVRAISVNTAPITPAATNALFSPYGMTAPSGASPAAANLCTLEAVNGAHAANDTYNINAALGGNDSACAMAFRFN